MFLLYRESSKEEYKKSSNESPMRNTIQIGRLSDMTVQSAAPSVRAPPEPQSKFKSKESMRPADSHKTSDIRKSNFALGQNNVDFSSSCSVSSSQSNTFDYSKQVLENKEMLKRYASNNPESAKMYDRTDSIVHPRVRKIELEEKINERAFKRNSRGKPLRDKRILEKREEEKGKFESEKSVKLRFTGRIKRYNR